MEKDMDIQRELEYLKQLTQKYGSHYIKSYFGFSMRDFAKRMGIADNTFSQILKGTRKMQPKYAQAFLGAFKELQVEEKTKGFKESPSQLQMKQLYQKRNILSRA
jgi:transcriptional regulator with XRE-family HTH domain